MVVAGVYAAFNGRIDFHVARGETKSARDGVATRRSPLCARPLGDRLMSRSIARATISALLLIAAWLASGLAAWAADVEKGFTPIFNGKDLTGWEGEPGYWSVRGRGAHRPNHRPETARPPQLYLLARRQAGRLRASGQLPLRGHVRQLGHQLPQPGIAQLGRQGLSGRHGSRAQLQRHPLRVQPDARS